MSNISNERLVASGDLATQMLSPKERRLLKDFDHAVAEIRTQHGEATTPEEDDHETNLAHQRVPGSRKALNKWGTLQEAFRLANNDQ